MKKKILAVTFGTAFLLSGTCLAKIADDQIALGGVAPGLNIEEVKATYGEPTLSYDGETLTFDSGLIVKIDEDRPNVVDEVIVKEANNLKTPAGVAVGMPEAALNDAYGQADDIDNEGMGVVEYSYRSVDRSKKIEFKVRNGVIVKIKCELRD